MGDLEPITRNEKLWSGEDLTPVTRKEMYIKHLYDETQVVPDYPVTREEMFILKAGEELHDVTIEQLTATENRTYSEEGVAYSPVIVNVPAPSVMSKNITENGDYSASDDNVYGYSSVHVAVPQTTLTTLDVSANGTYTAPSGTGYNEVDVNVPLPSNAYLLKEIEDVEIATFLDGSDLPMPKLEVAIEPVQEGSGDPSPTNIRPISGWDECNVTRRCGENLFGGTYNNIYSLYIPKNTRITVSTKAPQVTHSRFAIYDKDQNRIDYWNINNVDSETGRYYRTFSFSADVYYVKFYDSPCEEMQIKFGTDVTYEPYNGQTYTIDLDGTRYGGKVDLVSGVMTVEKVGVDLGTLSWNKDSGRFVAQLPNDSQTYVYNSDLSDLISDMWTPKVRNAGWNDMADGQYGIAERQLRIKYSSVETKEAFATFVNGSIFVYPLATPLTIQLTPTVVKSLQGINNVFADTGNILDLSYLAKEE